VWGGSSNGHDHGVKVRFWGTRGSIATPGPATVRYGGNTSCVELRSPGGELVVLDCGTGARQLGLELGARARATGVATTGSILLGHTHWDHIQGIPFFEPLFDPGGHWHLYGPRGLGTSLLQTLAGQMEYQYFPVGFDQLDARVDHHELVEGTFAIGDLEIRTQYLNHPAITLGYRIESGGAALCYIADHEPFDAALGNGGDVNDNRQDRRHVEFLAGADLVIHDAQYLASEYPAKVGWGHSTVEYVVDVAVAAGVGTLVLNHHDPSRDDDAVDRLLERARQRAGGAVEIVAATEGDQITVEGRHPGRNGRPSARPAVISPALHDMPSAVIVVTSDRSLAGAIAEAASSEQLEVIDGERIGVAIVDQRQLLLVVDIDDAATAPIVDRLRRNAPARFTTVEVTRGAPAVGADVIVWPATTAHVRTRLRAAVLDRACRWQAAPLPPDEQRRLAALRDLAVLDTPPEPRFDRFTDAVCEALDVPIALITLVDGDRQWFKSRRGVGYAESERDRSVCAHAILAPDVMQVPDLLADDRFADNPAVTGPGRVRFYAGAPLELDDGSRVGTLCAIDHRPRWLDRQQIGELRRLASEVVSELTRGAP
jgi:phosphoribosyl 1,2-cyclic phosphodiesterase